MLYAYYIYAEVNHLFYENCLKIYQTELSRPSDFLVYFDYLLLLYEFYLA